MLNNKKEKDIIVEKKGENTIGNEIIVDERQKSNQYKIESRAYGIIIILLFISGFVKEEILLLPLPYYITEASIFLLMSSYMLFVSIKNGLLLGNNKDVEPKTIISVLFFFSIIYSIFDVRSQIKSNEIINNIPFAFIKSLFIFFSVCVILFYVLNYFNEKSKKKLNLELDKEEMKM